MSGRLLPLGYNLLMRFIFLVFLLFIFQGLSNSFYISSAHAAEDPLSVPNNRVGVHILEPSELSEAALLVNSSGGDWGYVTIPIRIDDRDPQKWRNFFLDCSRLHLIPLIRLATYFSSDYWVTPTALDIVDFANFLSDMPWPTKNRYVIVFNEPNHSNEWGGYVSPEEYARILATAKNEFLLRSSDYFIISAGMDMSAPTNHTSSDALEYYRRMTKSLPDWYSYIDGLAVHAYPNPGFSSSPYSSSRYGISSYIHEINYLRRLGLTVSKPVFITETGYPGSSSFYTPAFSQIWNENYLVAITPFVLFAGSGDFTRFSLLNLDRKPTLHYREIISLSKIAGSPLLSPISESFKAGNSSSLGPNFSPSKPTFLQKVKNFLIPSTPKLYIGMTHFNVEIADTPKTRNQGLSGRKSLPENSGLLFVFPNSGLYQFWMKDMNFPLDFVWINQGKVVEITENVPPPSQTQNQPRTVNPFFPVDHVLEVNSGFVSKNNIKVGDVVVLNSP
jgi:uncharacterized membrane protein (UPF0127 family)